MSFLSWQCRISEKKVNLQILFLVGVYALTTYPSALTLVNEWAKWDQALSHGFACLGLFVFFIWRQPFVNQESVKPSVWAILFLGVNSLFWCCAQLANLQLPSYVFMFVGCWLLLINVFSWQLAVKLLPLFGLFLFAIPVWSAINDLLVELSGGAVNLILKYSSLTLHIQDNQIMTPWGTIVIADGCSGLRYLVIALLIAYLLCLLNRYQIKISIAVFIIAALLGLVTNWIRILIIILIGYYTEMQHSLVRDHEFFGWILFASILFPALYFSPQFTINPSPIIGKVRFSWMIVIAGLVGPLIYFSTPFSNNANPIQLSTLDQQYVRTFTEPSLDIQYPQTGHIETSSIILNEVVINLALVIATPSHKNEKIVPYFNKLYDNYYWKSAKKINLPNSNLEVLENRNHQQRVILIHKFQVGSFTTRYYYQAKLLQIPAKLINQAYFGLWIAQASCRSDCEKELIAIKKLDAQW